MLQTLLIIFTQKVIIVQHFGIYKIGGYLIFLHLIQINYIQIYRVIQAR